MRFYSLLPGAGKVLKHQRLPAMHSAAQLLLGTLRDGYNRGKRAEEAQTGEVEMT